MGAIGPIRLRPALQRALQTHKGCKSYHLVKMCEHKNVWS